jgi:hypothetical protein
MGLAAYGHTGRFHVKRTGILLGLAGLILLDWAALHDLLIGEPDVRLEWAVLGFSALAYALLLWKALALRRQRQE